MGKTFKKNDPRVSTAINQKKRKEHFDAFNSNLAELGSDVTADDILGMLESAESRPQCIGSGNRSSGSNRKPIFKTAGSRARGGASKNPTDAG